MADRSGNLLFYLHIQLRACGASLARHIRTHFVGCKTAGSAGAVVGLVQQDGLLCQRSRAACQRDWCWSM